MASSKPEKTAPSTAVLTAPDATTATPVLVQNAQPTVVSVTPSTSAINKVDLKDPETPALESLIQKLILQSNPGSAPTEPRPSLKTSDFFTRLNIEHNVEIDQGGQFTIDVQSDMRYTLCYILYNISALYPELDTKGFPFVSTTSLAGYCLAIYYAQTYMNDVNSRSMPSPYTFRFRQDADLRDFVKTISELRVPECMQDLITKLATYIDPQRPGLRYNANLASALFKYDFGFLFPIHVLFRAHDLLASTRSNIDPQHLMRAFYASPLVNYEGTAYTIGQLFGAPYMILNDIFDHANWLRNYFENFFNPVIHKSLLQRPTLAKIPLTPNTFDQDEPWNPYGYVFSVTDDNLPTLDRCLKSISNFILKNEPTAKTVQEIQAQIKGITLLTHSITGAELPTHHHLTVATDLKKAATILSDKTYANRIHFLIDPPTGTFKPAAAKATDKYKIASSSPTDELPYSFKKFNPRRDVFPTTLWYQPFDKRPELLKYSLVAGIRIMQEGLDGIAIPTPNTADPLYDINSSFICGSLRANRFYPYNPNVDQANYLAMVSRAEHEMPLYEPIGFALRDMSKNVYPTFHNEALAVDPETFDTFNRETNHRIPGYGFTYFATTAATAAPIEEGLLVGWSSYRYTPQNVVSSADTTRFYITLRGFYGVDTTYSRTRHPALLLPQ